jgi:chromosome segregation ATPase
MGNEKYLNYYVEILTSTMTDAVIRNISLQSNARVTEDVINEQVEKNNEYEKIIENLKNESELIKIGKNQESDSKILNLENIIKGHIERISDLEKQLNDLNNLKNEYENVKHQVGHLDTFRNELNKERGNHKQTHNEYKLKIEELNNQIEYLQLTPAKRKKLDEEKDKDLEKTNQSSVLPLIDDTTKDGGSF